MKTLKLSDIYNMSKEEVENLNFHFTDIRNEDKIDTQGLQALQGSNSNGEHRK